MARISFSRQILVFQVVYDYDDIELHEHRHIIEYFDTFDGVCAYLDNCNKEIKMLSGQLDSVAPAEFYHTRCNIRFKISQTSVSEKQFVSLFKNIKS